MGLKPRFDEFRFENSFVIDDQKFRFFNFSENFGRC